MGKDGGKDTGAGSGTGSGTEDTGAIPVSDTDMAESTLVAESPSFHVTFDTRHAHGLNRFNGRSPSLE